MSLSSLRLERGRCYSGPEGARVCWSWFPGGSCCCWQTDDGLAGRPRPGTKMRDEHIEIMTVLTRYAVLGLPKLLDDAIRHLSYSQLLTFVAWSTAPSRGVLTEEGTNLPTRLPLQYLEISPVFGVKHASGPGIPIVASHARNRTHNPKDGGRSSRAQPLGTAPIASSNTPPAWASSMVR